jgi:uncharacterized protein YdaU (DUF1376 family)
MSRFPYLPMYVGDYLKKTRHLTTEQHGAYLLILFDLWEHGGSIPFDHNLLARVANITPKRWGRIWDALEGYFTVSDGKLSHERLNQEIQKCLQISQKRKHAGKLGGEARSLKSQGGEQAFAKQMVKQTDSMSESYSDIEEKEEPKGSSKKKVSSTRGTRLPETWTLPTEWADEAYQYRTPNGEYLTAEEISHEAAKFRDYWIAQPGTKGTKLNWKSTWSNWIRNGAPGIIRARHAARGGRGGGGGQHEKPTLAAEFLRRAREREIRNPLSNGPDDWFDDVEGRGGGGEVVPLRRLTDW